jgi:hypothetical protein
MATRTIQKKIFQAAARRILADLKPAPPRRNVRETINVFNSGLILDKRQFDRIKYDLSRKALKKLISMIR